MIDACIVAKLNADTAVQALVAARIYPLSLPDKAPKPAITYRIVSTVRDRDLDGPTGLVEVRLELNGWATTYAQARKLGKALTAALDDFSGPLTSSEGNCDVLLITQDDDDTDFDQVERSHYCQQDYLIQFTE